MMAALCRAASRAFLGPWGGAIILVISGLVMFAGVGLVLHFANWIDAL
jgi:hypothetical protein